MLIFAVLQLFVARNAPCCAGLVVAQVTPIDDPIVHRLSVNPQICLLCCLVITLRTGKLNPLACSAGELSAIAYQQNSDDICYTEIEESSSVQLGGGCLAFVPSMI